MARNGTSEVRKTAKGSFISRSGVPLSLNITTKAVEEYIYTIVSFGWIEEATEALHNCDWANIKYSLYKNAKERRNKRRGRKLGVFVQ